MAGPRFQTKLTIVYLALFLAVQAVIVFAIYNSVTQNVQTQVRDQLAASARVFDQIIGNRVQVVGSRAQDLSRDFGFRQAVATRDSATITSALTNLMSRARSTAGFGIDVNAFVIDLDDQLLGFAGNEQLAQNATRLSDEFKEIADDDGYAARFIALDGEIYEMVIAPVVAPVQVGWVGLGIRLDEGVVSQMKELSPIDLELAFIYESDGGHELATATAGAEALSGFLKTQQGLALADEYQSSFGGQDYMLRRLSLQDSSTQTGHVDALLYYSLDVGLRPYQPLVVALLSVLAIGLVMLIIGSLLVARGITRPLRLLAEAAQRISNGDYRAVTAPAKDEEISRLTGSFNQMVDAVREREERITFQACHDSDTGLPNRAYFEDQIEPMLAGDTPFNIGVVQIERFPELRAVLTQEHITDMMRGVAHRLNGVNIAHLSQLTTDTFVFASFEGDKVDVCSSMIVKNFDQPMPVGEFMLDLRVIIGLAKFPENGNDISTLLRHANSALDGARISDERFSWYDAELSAAQRDKLSMMSDLREALKVGEVTFAYQPKLDVKSGKITSAEALMRWISPTRGFVPPDEFISMAEKTGDVRRLTDWALEAAIKQIADWQERGIGLAVAVNLSTNDLMNSTLPNQVLELLRRYNVPAAMLKLEVTESAVMHDMSRALEVLNMLGAMGVKLSIDDYGTGYSSLSYIKSLPVSEIKIDKSFVLKLAEDDEDKILVRSTIELAHNLGMQVTAEGVENEESVELLRGYGCDTLQGYHICRPVAAADLEDFLKERQHAAE